MAAKESDIKRAKAKNYAFTLLRNRPRSERELRERLKMKGFEDETVDIVIADLARVGYVNDAKFAKFLIDSRMHMNPVGDVLLKYQLKDKGVDDAIIDAALGEKAKSYDEYGLALEMAKERFERLRKLDRRKAAKRVYDFLLRRGFKYDTVRKIIEELTK